LSDRIYILSGSPGQITDEIEIAEKRPRARDFSLTPAFLSYKKQIVTALGPGSFRI
jgi:ABC-type nitrate/sulfonate/bicarbonate transport system ATPase subunit